MKSVLINFIFLILIISLSGMQSCKKDDESTDAKTKSQIEDNVQTGTWRITLFNDSGKDETSHFNGYEIMFNSNSSLRADNGVNAHEGTWFITESKSNDDNPDDLHFSINFNLNNEFEDLNDDWNIVTHNEIKIELKDVSGGDGSIDYLTFEKN